MLHHLSHYGCLTGVEPLPNIRDGILVERLVKNVRYVADMRRCQYVVQRPEGVRRGQRLVHGTGMGLSIANTIVRAHGGSLRVANQRGRGCVFSFTLPADPYQQI
jgi:light-regulated signal transduction histidine kinase (bacteriophytochrome)